MASGGTSMQMNATIAISVKVSRMAGTRPIAGTNAPQMTGATYASAVPATHVNEIAVEMASCCLELCPSSAMSALYGVQ